VDYKGKENIAGCVETPMQGGVGLWATSSRWRRRGGEIRGWGQTKSVQKGGGSVGEKYGEDGRQRGEKI